MQRIRTSTLVAVAVLVGCADDGPGPGAAEPMTVQVWFARGEEPVAVERQIRGAPLEGAIRALLSGPTEVESQTGLASWFSADTQGLVRRIQVADGLAVIDFREELRERIPGAGSSAGSQQLLTSLDSTAFQFAAIDSVEYRLGGSCDEFWEWLQRSCQRVVR